MKKNFNRFADFGLAQYMVIASGFLYFPARAAATTGNPPETVNEVMSVLIRFIGNVGKIFWVAAVLFVLYSAFLYMTAGDSKERLVKAKSQLLYTIIAMAVALIATALPFLVQNILST